MTLSDPYRGFKIAEFFEVISEQQVLGKSYYRTLRGNAFY